jgi:hypothetical protein
MDSTKGNADMHFGKIAIKVDPVGHDLFQRMSNGIKAGDQNVTGKQIREAITFLATAQYALWTADTSTKLPTRAHGTLTSPTRPPGYSNMTKRKRRRLRKHDSCRRTNNEKSAEGGGGSWH